MLLTLSKSEQYWTTSIKIKPIQVDAHLKTSMPSASMVELELQNDSQAADYATMIDDYLDHERKGSGGHRFHLTRFCNLSRERCGRV